MNCHEFQNHLAEYVAGRLPGSQCALMQAHAKTCSVCAREEGEERDLRSWVDAAPVPPECTDVWPRLVGELRSTPRRGRAGSPTWALGGVSVALAACACLFWMRPGALTPVSPMLQSHSVAHAADETKVLQLVADLRRAPLAQSDLLLEHIRNDREERSILLGSRGEE